MLDQVIVRYSIQVSKCLVVGVIDPAPTTNSLLKGVSLPIAPLLKNLSRLQPEWLRPRSLAVFCLNFDPYEALISLRCIAGFHRCD